MDHTEKRKLLFQLRTLEIGVAHKFERRKLDLVLLGDTPRGVTLRDELVGLLARLTTLRSAILTLEGDILGDAPTDPDALGQAARLLTVGDDPR